MRLNRSPSYPPRRGREMEEITTKIFVELRGANSEFLLLKEKGWDEVFVTDICIS